MNIHHFSRCRWGDSHHRQVWNLLFSSRVGLGMQWLFYTRIISWKTSHTFHNNRLWENTDRATKAIDLCIWLVREAQVQELKFTGYYHGRHWTELRVMEPIIPVMWLLLLLELVEFWPVGGKHCCSRFTEWRLSVYHFRAEPRKLLRIQCEVLDELEAV